MAEVRLRMVVGGPGFAACRGWRKAKLGRGLIRDGDAVGRFGDLGGLRVLAFSSACGRIGTVGRASGVGGFDGLRRMRPCRE